MDVVMPQLGETVREGTVLSWKKQVGDEVRVDEPLFEVETDKVTMEVPAPANGILTQILVEEGMQVKVGTRLAIVTEFAEARHAQPQPVTAAAEAADGNGGVRLRDEGVAALAVVRGAKLSPVVRRLLAENSLAADAIRGSGRDGRIRRADVLAYLERGHSAGPGAERRADAAVAAVTAMPVTDVGGDDYVVPLTRVRRATAAHMVRSRATSPHTLQAVEVDFHGVERVRREFGADLKASEGYGLTYLPFIARAVCEAIKAFPYVNSSFGNDELIVHKRIHLGIAVDVNFEALMVAVVRDAQYRNLRGIGAEIHRLTTAIRASRASSDDVSGATYTISNSGSFGTLFSAAIINQPQTAILSTDGVRKRAVVVERPDGDSIAIRPVGILAQSFDHRAFDGAYSAAFLRRLREFIEQRDWAAELS
ncbi:MAG: 2-oxo acid dehydrogenase subunit E2 [Alphaproteobacteria bacterium]|nr:2-oxo acid dehydrogenase subunit E2 [Alphaproteobacteria bacterium]